MSMGKLEFGTLRQAWQGEATDFTPLLAQQLDIIGEAIGQPLIEIGQAEVRTEYGRRIDIVAQADDGTTFVIENQYKSADHDHLTRGLAYAVGSNARGLIVVAEEHRDEFRAVAQYLNEMREHDLDRGIAVWLVEAQAVRIGDSPWAPLFTPVVAPNAFTAKVEKESQQFKSAISLAEFLSQCDSDEIRDAVGKIAAEWEQDGHILWRYAAHIALAAAGPGKSGTRSVVTLYKDGRITVPFGAYAGANTGIPVEVLATPEFRSRVEQQLGIEGTPSASSSQPGWLAPSKVPALLTFARQVADAYAAVLRS